MSIPQNSAWRTRLVEREFPDRSFDIEFWQERGDEAIFAAAWEMVELAEEISHGTCGYFCRRWNSFISRAASSILPCLR